MELLFLDVETTGLENEDRLVEVGFKISDVTMTERFKAPVPVKIGAMAVNHITNTMLESCRPFEGSIMQQILKDTAAKDDVVFVAHNAPFDIGMLAKDGVVFTKYIDTKKLSHALDKDDSMESHRLQYLRYYYGVELPKAEAHTAEGDIAVLEAVYHALVSLLGNPTIEEQIAISKRPVLYTKFKFGKYNGNSIADIASVDPNYLQWLLDQKKNNNQNEDDWIYTLEHYLNY